MSKGVTGQRESEIEVTPEMVEAGAAAFYGYDPAFDNGETMTREILEAVFAANPAEPKAVRYLDPGKELG